MATHVTIQARRCTRCGVVQQAPPLNGLCATCTTWTAKPKVTTSQTIMTTEK